LIHVLPLQYAREGDALLAVKTLPGGVGYIRIADSLGEADLIREFDTALARFRNTSALILDLRNTPGGGNTTVARGILGCRLKESPYRAVLVGEERSTGVRRSWPRCLLWPRFAQALLVLINHHGAWEEGLAIGSMPREPDRRRNRDGRSSRRDVSLRASLRKSAKPAGGAVTQPPERRVKTSGLAYVSLAALP
jgi:hypothetical protein